MKHIKITSVLMSVAIAMSMAVLPASVIADETESTEVAETNETTETAPDETIKSSEKEMEKPAETEASETKETEPAETETSEPIPSESKREEETVPSESQPFEEPSAPVDETAPSETDSHEAKNKVIGSGTCGDNVNWAVDDNGALTITGTSDVYDYDSHGPWYDKYGAKIKSIVIADGVTGYGVNCFKGLPNVTSVSIAGSVKWLENYSFSDCKKLTSVTLAEGTSVLGTAFQGCQALKSINFPSTVRNISQKAFEGCKSLTAVSLPSGISNVGTNAFSGCTSLKTVKLPDNITKIYDGTFSGCTALTSISIPKGVTLIGENAFSGCTSLTSVNLPDTLNEIHAEAFKNCKSLTGIRLPDGCINYGYSVFSGCTGLTSISIPDGTVRINTNEFSGCVNLKTISLPKSIKYLSDASLSGCNSLTDIYYKGTASDWSNVNFMGSAADEIKNVNIHFSGTFRSINVKSVEGGCITLSKYSAIAGEEIEITSTPEPGYYLDYVKMNGQRCSRYSFKMPDENVTVEPFFTQIVQANVGDTDYDLNGILVFKITNNAINGTGTVMCQGVMGVAGIDPSVNYYEKIVIPATVELRGVVYKITAIDAKAFYRLTDMKYLTIGSNVVTIGNNAFDGCTGLVKVSGGSKVKTIGANAFAGCTKLSSFTITSKYLSKIGTYAFNKDSKLKTLYFKYTTKLTKKGVKKSLKGSKVKTVKVKKSKVKKYKKYFTKKNCGRKVKVKK